MKEFFHFADIHLIATFIHHIAHLLILVLNSILKPLSIFMCTTCTSTLKFLSRFFNIFHLMNYEQLLQYINVMIKVFSSSLARFLVEKWKISEKRAKMTNVRLRGMAMRRECLWIEQQLENFCNAFVNDLNFVLLSHLLRNVTEIFEISQKQNLN